MAVIGNSPTQQTYVPQIDYFSGNGSTTVFTLSRPVATAAQMVVFIENVPQNPSTAFTVNNTTLTFTSAPPSGSNNIWVEYTSLITQMLVPAQGTVTNASFATGASEFASGTALLFQQTAAPTGWTKVTSNNNAALRVVSGTVTSGGTVDFTTAFASQSVSGTVGTTGSTTVSGTVGATTLSTAQMPSHNHAINYDYLDPVTGHNHGSRGGYLMQGSLQRQGSGADANMMYGTGSSNSHDHSFSSGAHTHTGGTFTGTAINLAVKYVDVIIATKD